jgi:Matrixin
MARTKTRSTSSSAAGDPFQPASGESSPPPQDVHVYGNRVVCETDTRGHAMPQGRSPVEIVVDATEGFVPLWAKNTTLRWRFRDSTFQRFANPVAAKAEIRRLFGDALLAWGDAVPVKFAQRNDAWDFEIVMRRTDDCDSTGCVLASAFFPDAGRHAITIYPKMLEQTRKEQVDTMVHEIGHVFGLRHFFANVSERRWASEIFGAHRPFSIMNYGSKSVLTAADRADLRRLYQQAWSRTLTNVNGTPIRFVRPYHLASRDEAEGGVALVEPAAAEALPRAAARRRR